MWILALKMADTCQGVESKAKVVADVGRQSLCPHMTIVVLIHAFHRLRPRLCCRGGNKRKDIHYITIKQRTKKLRVHSLESIVV